MNARREHVDMGFTKDVFPEGTHMCLIYDDDEHRRSVIGRFLARGIALGEKVSYFADTSTPAEVQSWLQEAGMASPRGNIMGNSTCARPRMSIVRPEDSFPRRCYPGSAAAMMPRFRPITVERA